MSIQVMSDVLKLKLEPSNKFVLLMLANYCDADGGSCFPSVARLVRDTCLSEATVHRSLKSLRDYCGLIAVVSGGGAKANRYQIDIGMVAKLASATPVTMTPLPDDTPIAMTPGGYHHDTGGVSPRHPRGVTMTPDPSLTANIPVSKTTKSAPASLLPDWMPVDAWAEWRKYKGKKLTPLAEKLQTAKLLELRSQGHDPTTVINLAIESGWATFYAPRPQSKTSLADLRAATLDGIFGRDRHEGRNGERDITGEAERIA